MIDNKTIEKLIEEDKPIYEPTNLDFKKAEEISNSLLETISAFANSSGGDVILGISQVKGIKLSYIGIQAAQDQESKIRDKLRNKIVGLNEKDYQISIENFSGFNLPIIKVHIERVQDVKRYPVYIKELGMFKGSFIRVGQRDEHMPSYMIDHTLEERLILEKKLPPIELRPIESAAIEDLNIELIKEFSNSLKTGVNLEGLSKEKLINFLECKNIINKEKVTMFGLLCFGSNPSKYLDYQATIQVSNETGIDIMKGERGQNKNIFEGSLLNLINESLKWCTQNLPTKRIVDIDGQSKEEIVIPSRILREVIVNVFCHKDYNEKERALIKINKDHLTINNPGLLKDRIYYKNFIIPGKTDQQNPTISKYLFRMIKAEGEGKGFTLLLQSCLAGEIDIPTITLDFSGRVTLDISAQKLINKEIQIWLETKKYIITIPLDPVDKMLIAYLYKAYDLIKKGKFVVNLSEECLNSKQKTSLDKLIQNKYIEVIGLASTKIFCISGILLENDYSVELLQLFGNDFIILDPQSKQIISYVMQFEKINIASSARKLTNLLYPNTPDDQLSQDISRNIRKKCAYLVKKHFLIRDPNVSPSSPKGNLRINYKYKELIKSSIESSPTQIGKQEKLGI